MTNDHKIVTINGWRFKDVTNETTGGDIYNYEEALALTKGKVIATGTNPVSIDRK